MFQDMNTLVHQGRIVKRRRVPEPEIGIVEKEGHSRKCQASGYKKDSALMQEGFDQPCWCA